MQMVDPSRSASLVNPTGRNSVGHSVGSEPNGSGSGIKGTPSKPTPPTGGGGAFLGEVARFCTSRRLPHALTGSRLGGKPQEPGINP